MASRGERAWRPGIALAVTMVMLGLLIAPVSAQGGSGPSDKFRSGNTITIRADETVPHDLYVGASTVRIDGRIEGDLFVVGGTVDISGPVTGDLFIAGGTIHVSGAVGRHLRVAGGDVTVDGPVKLDLLAVAGNLTVGKGAAIEGDAIFSAGQVQLDGTVAGSALGSAETYAKTGRVAGTENVTLTSRPEQAARPAPTLGERFLEQVQRYLSILIVGALLLLLAPRLVRPAATLVRSQPARSLGIGGLGLVGFLPVVVGLLIAMVLLVVSLSVLGLGGLVAVAVVAGLLSAAALSLVFATVVAFVGAALVGVVLGQIVLEQMHLEGWGAYAALAVGVVVVVAITALPYVGWLARAVVAALGFGALLVELWRRRPGTSQAAVASNVP